MQQNFLENKMMRYPANHKTVARAKMIEAGGALAKKSGFSNTGMDALTSAAGVTTGAFYSQFQSKAELLYAIIDYELSRTVEAFDGKTEADFVKTLAWYVSPKHAAHPELGCPIPSLGAEIARADDNTRQRFEELTEQLVNALNKNLQDKNKSWALLSQAIGAVVLARAVLSPNKQQEILNAVQSASLSMLEKS